MKKPFSNKKAVMTLYSDLLAGIKTRIRQARMRHESDNTTIGLILCQEKNRVLAEYALRGLDKPIGISEYELTRALPDNLKSVLPTIEEIEAELSAGLQEKKERRSDD